MSFDICLTFPPLLSFFFSHSKHPSSPKRFLFQRQRYEFLKLCVDIHVQAEKLLDDISLLLMEDVVDDDEKKGKEWMMRKKRGKIWTVCITLCCWFTSHHLHPKVRFPLPTSVRVREVDEEEEVSLCSFRPRIESLGSCPKRVSLFENSLEESCSKLFREWIHLRTDCHD